MLKIIDLLSGETIVHDLDEEFVETQLLKYIAAEYEEDLPEFFWLSPEAIEGILSDEPEEPEEGEEDYSYEDDDEEMQMGMLFLSNRVISDELRTVLENLLDYISNNSDFIDADDNAIADPNEKGCYMAFEHFAIRGEYRVCGTVKKGSSYPAGLRLQLYDDEIMGDNFVGFGFTDSEGNYEIEFKKEHFTKNPGNIKGTPPLYIIVSKFDKVKSEFNQIKRFDIPPAEKKEINFEIQLQEI